MNFDIKMTVPRYIVSEGPRTDADEGTFKYTCIDSPVQAGNLSLVMFSSPEAAEEFIQAAEMTGCVPTFLDYRTMPLGLRVAVEEHLVDSIVIDPPYDFGDSITFLRLMEIDDVLIALAGAGDEPVEAVAGLYGFGHSLGETN